MTVTERYADVKTTLKKTGFTDPRILAHIIHELVKEHGLVSVVRLIDLDDVWVYFRAFGDTWCRGAKAEIVSLGHHQMRRSLAESRLLRINERGLPTTLTRW
jgi:hypothetical protein